MTITPVSPIDLEKLVSINTSIVVNLTYMPAQVDVNGVTVFDGTFFQASWTGSILNRLDGGKRLVLTPPAAFAVGQLVVVYVLEVGGASLQYKFQCGTARATSTADANLPSMSNVPGGSTYLSYVKDSGAMYVRFTGPLSPEIEMIKATIVDVGYDPTLNKLVVFFVNNGKVFATVADPGDGPNSILPPGEAETPVKAVAFPFESLPVVSAAGAGAPTTPYVGFPRSPAPVVVGGNPRVVRIPRPTDIPESSLIEGFYIYKTSDRYAGGRISEFIPMPPGAAYAEWQDSTPTYDAVYAAIGVYRNGQTTGTVVAGIGSSDLSTSFFYGLDVHTLTSEAGAGLSVTYESANFFPVKQAPPVDLIVLSTGTGAGAYGEFQITGAVFPVKLATAPDPYVLSTECGASSYQDFGR